MTGGGVAVFELAALHLRGKWATSGCTYVFLFQVSSSRVVYGALETSRKTGRRRGCEEWRHRIDTWQHEVAALSFDQPSYTWAGASGRPRTPHTHHPRTCLIPQPCSSITCRCAKEHIETHHSQLWSVKRIGRPIVMHASPGLCEDGGRAVLPGVDPSVMGKCAPKERRKGGKVPFGGEFDVGRRAKDVSLACWVLRARGVSLSSKSPPMPATTSSSSVQLSLVPPPSLAAFAYVLLLAHHMPPPALP